MSWFLELVERVIERVWTRAKWHGFYFYAVDGESDDGARVTLRHVGDAGGLPDLVSVEKRHGLHGITTVAADGMQVLVGFEGGDPARPFVGFYFRDNPKTTLIDADDWIQIITTEPERPEKRVHIGSTDRKPVARKDDPVACGTLHIVGGPGIATFILTTQDGGVQTLGVLAGTGLTFTPDPSTAGLGGITGKIMSGSTLFDSQ